MSYDTEYRWLEDNGIDFTYDWYWNRDHNPGFLYIVRVYTFYKSEDELVFKLKFYNDQQVETRLRPYPKNT